MHGQHKLTINSVERAVRRAVCPVCYQRPQGSERLGNHVPRACQPRCPIFLNLPKLYRIAVHTNTSTPGALDTWIKHTICPDCAVSPTHGDFCAEFQNRSCPLSRFSGEVVILIETLREWQRRAVSATTT